MKPAARINVRRGDRVDFGAYGARYVACLGDGRSLWVTKKKWERINPRAPGQYMEASLARRIIERYRRGRQVP